MGDAPFTTKIARRVIRVPPRPVAGLRGVVGRAANLIPLTFDLRVKQTQVQVGPKMEGLRSDGSFLGSYSRRLDEGRSLLHRRVDS